MRDFMEKLLTVAVPCHNAAWCLDKCLFSFLNEAVMDRLKVIIVNDGSTDNTLEIAEKYQQRYPQVFRVIDKENGGHGSGINAAIKLAAGKYFKVVDADDWVLTENLESFLDILENTRADAILTHFHTVDMTTGERREYKTRDISLNKLYTLEEFTALPGEIYPCASFHGLTYRTEVYKGSGTILSEGIFYEDQEYAALPFAKVKTVLPLDMFLYEYLIGNASQSVSDQNQVKRLYHVEQVVRRLFEAARDCTDLSEGAKRYIARKAGDMLLSYYVIAMIKNPNKSGGRHAAEQMRQEMQALAPEIVSATDNRYKLAVLMNRLGFGGKMLELMKTPLPYTIFRRLFKKNKG